MAAIVEAAYTPEQCHTDMHSKRNCKLEWSIVHRVHIQNTACYSQGKKYSSRNTCSDKLNLYWLAEVNVAEANAILKLFISCQ